MQINPESDPSELPSFKISRFEIALVVTLVVIWVPGILQLAEVWSSLAYASHGPLVPFVSLWAATVHRKELRQLESRALPGGLILIAITALCYLAALVFNDPTLLGLVAVATVAVSVLALRGAAWLRRLRFPLGYLLFMVPLPVAWVTPVIVKLQILVSSVGVMILQQGGVAIFREGNVLTLPGDESLFVAEACSGITSLITLLPIGVFIGYFTESILWRRLVLIGAVIPIALAGNLLRVILTVLFSIEVSVEFATQGPLHEWAGITTYVIGCLCLLAVGAFMQRFVPIAGTDPSHS